MQTLTLWELKQLAFVKGESVVELKKNQLDVLMNYLVASKSEKPFEVQQKAEESWISPISITPELTPEEIKRAQSEHNLSVVKEFFEP